MSVKKRYMLLYTEEHLFEHPDIIEAANSEEAENKAHDMQRCDSYPYDIRTTDFEVIEVNEHGHIVDEYGLSVPHVELEEADILRDIGGEG